MISPFPIEGANLPEVPRPITPLDVQQWWAAVSDDSRRLVVGGFGTGKTRTVLARVIALIKAGEPVDSITVLTFSGSAAETMKLAIERSIGQEKLSASTNDIFVGTPHSFCLKFLREVGVPPLGLGTDFILWDQQQCAGVIERLSEDPNLRNRTLRPEELGRLMAWHSLNCHRYDLGDINAEDGSWHRLKTAFNAEKRKLQALDFDEVTLFTLFTLSKNPDLCERLSEGRTRHLLFDDFQECTTLQYELFRLLTRHSCTVTIAADPNQQIDATRGSDSWVLTKFCDDYKVPAPFHLTLNHRATDAMVNVAEALQKSMDLPSVQLDHQKRLRLQSAHPQLLVHDGPIGELDRLAVDISQSLHDHDGYEFEDIAVLYPNHSAGPRIATRMGARRIPFQMLDQPLDPQAPDYELARSLLGLAVLPRNQAAFHKAATSALHKDQVKRVNSLIPQIVHIAQELNGDLMGATDLYLKRGPRDSILVRRLRHIVDAVAMLRNDLAEPGTSVASTVRIACNQVALTTRTGTLPILSPTLCRLIDAAESFPVTGRDTSHLGLIGFLDHLAASSDPVQRTPVTGPLFYPQRGVALGTIRSSQGRQWKAVLLIDCTDEAIPGNLDNAVDVDEPQRLFYVAVTRAADRLYLLVPLVGEAHQRQNPSRFITPLTGLLERMQV